MELLGEYPANVGCIRHSRFSAKTSEHVPKMSILSRRFPKSIQLGMVPVYRPGNW